VPLAANLGAGELAINYTDGKLFYKDNSAAIQVIGWKTTPTTAGGTGLTSYTAGDLPYYASGTALSKLGIGTANYVLTSSGTAPQYVAQSTLSVGSATNATNTAITDNTSSSATWYPTIVSATTGNLPQTTSSTKLSFVPSTGILTATGFSGAHNGTVGATTPTTGAFTTVTASTSVVSPTIGAGSSTNLNLQSNGTTNAILDSNGNFLVGVSATAASFRSRIYWSTGAGQNGVLLEDGSNSSGTTFLYFVENGTGIGSVARVGSTNAVVYNTTSDYRLKNVIGSVTGQGERIDALNPVDYQWIDGGQNARGFLAHEFQQIYLNSVTGTKDAVDVNGKPVYQSMQASTSEVIADLVAEIKSIRSRLKAANIA